MSRGSGSLPDNDAVTAALLFAVDPQGLGGIILHGMPGHSRDRWLAGLRVLLPAGTPWRKVPVNVGEDRLLGGLDFAATLATRRPVFASGVIESTDGGILLLAMAERQSPAVAAILGGVLDRGEIRVERDGVARTAPARIGVIALDESIDDEEGIADGLADRLAFRLRLADLPPDLGSFGHWNMHDIVAARSRLAGVGAAGVIIDRLCGTSSVFGIGSARADLFALRAARAAAALQGRDSVSDEDAELAARLVLPHRATCMPPQDDAAANDTPDESRQNSEDAQSGADQQSSAIPDDVLVDAVRATLPPGLLALLTQQGGKKKRVSAGSRGGPRSLSHRRGRPVGVKQVDTLAGARLNVLATLKTAAPWQALRCQDNGGRRAGLQLRKEDLRVTRFEDSVETTTVFVVDASGSQAARRLAEVKGAIEILLNDCYVRRDQVALVAFRGTVAEVLLSPTRALARAKRSLAALPGGGGTPLAAGLDIARELAESVAHHGRVPAIVLMTDGRANIARDQQQDIKRAEDDALDAARQLQLAGFRSMLVDTSRRPRPRARKLAESMGAHYVPLPQADAAAISATVQVHTA